MKLTRREFTRAATGLAGLALVGPVEALIPDAVEVQRVVRLGPARLKEPRPVCLQTPFPFFNWDAKRGDERKELVLVPDAWAYILEPFPPEFEVDLHKDVQAFFMVQEFTEEARPGSNGGCIGVLPECVPPPELGTGHVRPASTVEPLIQYMADGSICVMFDAKRLVDCRLPDLPLWVRAEGVLRS